MTRLLVVQPDDSDPPAALGVWLTSAGAELHVVRPFAEPLVRGGRLERARPRLRVGDRFRIPWGDSTIHCGRLGKIVGRHRPGSWMRTR
ncbi:hypothetical protein ACFQ1S_33835 [Kibdelosporangium lantanae]|uniref:Uncharacterized protein n=1 Tax=Kibdelosporangium lantanae TaxID=1497396 RepID=A0ABW3MHD1_9PSEU